MTGIFDNTAQVWDANTGTELLTIKLPTTGNLWKSLNWLSAASFSADGSRLVTCAGIHAFVYDSRPFADTVLDIEQPRPVLPPKSVGPPLGDPAREAAEAVFSVGGKVHVVGGERPVEVRPTEPPPEPETRRGLPNSLAGVCVARPGFAPGADLGKESGRRASRHAGNPEAVIKGGTLTLLGGPWGCNPGAVYSLKADSWQSPPAIELESTGRPGEKFLDRGISKLEKDELTIAVVRIGERPKDFEPRPGVTVLALKLK